MLHATRTGSGPPVVLVHGFTQTGRSWAALAPMLAADHEVIAVDLPGHGRSGPATDLWSTADDLVQAGGRAAYVGYSLGGRVALHAALAHPHSVERLVLLSATAGIDDDGQRSDRLAADAGLAADLERDGLGPFLDRWLAGPLFVGLSPDSAGRDDRRTNTVAGLAASLRLAGTGTMDPPLWPRLPELTMPVLVVAGALDERFGLLGRRMASEIGANAHFELIPHAGHSAHLEQPERFWQVVEPFLRS